MSSPSSSPENAATPAPVSQAHADEAHAEPVPGTAADAALQPVGPDVAGQQAASAQLTAHTSAPASAAHAVDQNKKSRGPALLQRSNGPSLLTQALASARGIPPPGQVEPALNSTNSASKPGQRLHDSAAPPSPSPSPSASSSSPFYAVTKPDPAQPTDTGARTTHDDSVSQGGGSSLTPRGSPGPGVMSSSAAVASTVVLPPSSGDVSSLATWDILDLDGYNSLLRAHHDVFSPSRGRGRGTSLERTERERRVQDMSSGLRTYSESAAQPHISNPSTENNTTAQGDNKTDTGQGLGTGSRLQRPRKIEHRMSLGPEKIWSIGSGELNQGQDGQVEKAITEVLAGVEPNARSRKASHSLRFFREGLPEEKGKRRESRLATSARDQLSPGAELATEKERETRANDDEPSQVHSLRHIADRDPPTPGRPIRVRSFPLQSPDDTKISKSPEDYFRVTHDERTRDASESGPPVVAPDARKPEGALPSPRSPLSTSELGPEGRRESGESTEVGERTEDGDDSGEEKISSAVFLPHQVPAESADLRRTSHGDNEPSVAGSRSLSRDEGFHPWLVKANEPETDDTTDQVSQEHALDAGYHRLEGGHHTIGTDTLTPKRTDSVILDDHEPPEAQPVKSSRPVPQYYEEHIHDHQLAPKQPLEAIELIPYKHQVGGHTTLWRFSRRAVCKQLNNRENEFYEKVERYHRDLLAFLPRYIGVLNVTFHKQPRRKSTIRREDGTALEPAQNDHNGSAVPPQQNGEFGQDEMARRRDDGSREPQRIISQSLQPSQGQVPTVTFVDNQHILPRYLLQPSAKPTSLPGRFRSTSASMTTGSEGGTDESTRTGDSRPRLEERHANSWGATLVNKRLRNEVFNDAFLKQSIPIQKHKKAHQRSLPRQTIQRILRPANSESNLAPQREEEEPVEATQQVLEGSPRVLQSQSDLGPQSPDGELGDDPPKDVTGTSAPEPEILGNHPPSQRRKRRYSGGALRRKPKNVCEPRGDLKYWQEPDDAGYKGDNDDNEEIAASEAGGESIQRAADGLYLSDETRPSRSAFRSEYASTVTSGATSPAEFKRIPRPVNPKEAQTQRDSRVEYFLLLEDLTAGMRRPCIMDLKMGTRQYGVDATPKKQKSQQRKCAETTSRELGVRVCGLQVWDVATQSYIFKDKYYGRNLKAGREFQDALTRFLYDGVDPSSILRHIPTVLHKLSNLEVIIRRLRGYRFYAASLLMFYDGDTSNQDYDTAIEDSTTDFATDTEDAREVRKSRKDKREIDFKIADFANSLTAGDLAKDKPCPPQHPNEPDHGFLRGLRSLRKCFLRIQQETRAQMGLVSQQRNVLYDPNLDISDDEGSVSE